MTPKNKVYNLKLYTYMLLKRTRVYLYIHIFRSEAICMSVCQSVHHAIKARPLILLVNIPIIMEHILIWVYNIHSSPTAWRQLYNSINLFYWFQPIFGVFWSDLIFFVGNSIKIIYIVVLRFFLFYNIWKDKYSFIFDYFTYFWLHLLLFKINCWIF